MPNTKKPKRRNTEKRKEKSRDAARCRRGKEAEIFADISKQLPVTAQQIEQLDKTSVMRLAISHLKLRTVFNTESRGHLVKDEHDIQYLKALDGFVMLFDSEGEIIYISENVCKYLGLSQLELLGQSVYEFAHPCDHDEIRETLTSTEDDNEHVFFMRLKCTLTSKGRNVNLKSATYKVIKCSGYFQCLDKTKLNLQLSTTGAEPIKCMTVVGSPVPHPSNIETPLDSQTFLSRHSMNMKFTYVDDRVEKLLGYEMDELLNKSVYEYHHALDNTALEKSYNNLFSKGQTETSMYRFLAKYGGYVWLQTQATVIYNTKTEKPESVVCVNYVISGIEDADIIFSSQQMKTHEDSKDNGHSYLPSTESLFPSRFVSKTRELTTTDFDLSDSFGDLACRAPSAGDSMISLDFPPEEEIINEKLDFLGELCEGSQQELPFMLSLHRETTPSPLNTMSTAPSPASMGSTDTTPFDTTTENDKQGIHHISSTDSLTIPESLIDEMEEIALELRAPYIPMSDDEDLVFSACPIPLLDEDDINANMLGTTETVFAPDPDEQKNNKQQPIPMSILKQLAQESANKMPGKDVARNAGPPKMKRPMETNRLETGPPIAKRVCREGIDNLRTPGTVIPTFSPPEASITSRGLEGTNNTANSGSVLMNLLSRGHDEKYGYNVPKRPPMEPQVEKPVQQSVVSSTQPVGAASSKASPLISLLRPATIQQLIQTRLAASGEGNIPIRLVLPQNTVVQPNSQLAHLLQAVATQQQPQAGVIPHQSINTA